MRSSNLAQVKGIVDPFFLLTDRQEELADRRADGRVARRAETSSSSHQDLPFPVLKLMGEWRFLAWDGGVWLVEKANGSDHQTSQDGCSS